MINVVPGTTVTVIDPRPSVLSFADNDVIENLQYTMRQNGAPASENGAIVSKVLAVVLSKQTYWIKYGIGQVGVRSTRPLPCIFPQETYLFLCVGNPIV